HYARLAFDALCILHGAGHSAWIGDIQWCLSQCGIDLPRFPVLISVDDVHALIKKVTAACHEDLQRQVDNSDRLYLLHGRLEPLENGRPKARVLHFRHYLSVKRADHRKSMTRLLLSDHHLAVEQLRRAARYVPSLPRDCRLCRFCQKAVETPEHAVLAHQQDM
ncbi:hypothetical protein BDZ89DRAFT_1202073, partial [Hymenopellis radicata]